MHFAGRLDDLVWVMWGLAVSACGSELVILSGQSNASGRVATGYEVHEVDLATRYYYWTDGPAGRVSASQGWVSLGPLPGSGFYGTEIALGRRLAEWGSSVAILKLSWGNTSLAVDWNSREGGEAWVEWRAATQAAIEDWGGDPPRVKAIVWLQGENDGFFAANARAYEANLVALWDDMLAHLGDLGADCSGTALVCGRVLDNQVHSSTVRSAQMIADVTVDTDDLSTFDGVHYDAVSVDVLGRRFADAVAAWEGDVDAGRTLWAVVDSFGLRVYWRSPLDQEISLMRSSDLKDWIPFFQRRARATLEVDLIPVDAGAGFLRLWQEPVDYGD